MIIILCCVIVIGFKDNLNNKFNIIPGGFLEFKIKILSNKIQLIKLDSLYT